MARKNDATAAYDPEGIRRVAAQLLASESPATREKAEDLITSRLGPYRPDPAVERAEIDAFFAAGR